MEWDDKKEENFKYMTKSFSSDKMDPRSDQTIRFNFFVGNWVQLLQKNSTKLF